jgi:hypothetical protein
MEDFELSKERPHNMPKWLRRAEKMPYLPLNSEPKKLSELSSEERRLVEKQLEKGPWARTMQALARFAVRFSTTTPKAERDRKIRNNGTAYLDKKWRKLVSHELVK